MAFLQRKSPSKSMLSQALHSCRVIGFASLLALTTGEGVAAATFQDEAPAPEDPLSTVNLCQWQRDYAFFTGGKKELPREEKQPCEVAFLEKKTQAAQLAEPVISVVPDEKRAFAEEIRTLVSGFPIEAMAPAIAEYDRDIAALIVGIAKKESNWGKRVPRDAQGADCFNYWGFKGAGARGVAMGHGCFGTPEEAVKAVGNRLSQLVELKKTSEPKNLTVWKCGSSCATHSPESVRKWIADVDIYFRQIAKK